MKEKALKNNNIGLVIALAVFFFVRTALLSPVHCLLMTSNYPYFKFTVEGIVFIALLVVFSALSSKLVFAFSNKAGDVAALVCIIAMSDPLFFGTQDNVLKLLVNIVIQLLIFNAIRDKRFVPMGIIIPITLFISAFLVPYSVFGYAPVLIGVFVLACRKSGKENKSAFVVLIGIVCAAAGFLINRVFVNKIPLFNELFATFGFAESGGTNKQLRIVYSVLPVAVFGFIFFRQYKKAADALLKKKSESNRNTEIVTDAFFLPAVISLVSIFFLDAEGFCAINLLVPAIILTLLCLKDEICIRAIDSISNFIKENRIISVVIFVAVFVLALTGIINYHSTKQLIFYIRY